jgi:two-component system catabolic regulation response regulator CreB
MRTGDETEGCLGPSAVRPRILVVEDEPAVADTIVYALRTDGCTPEWVSNGAALIAALNRDDIDLIVLDVGLPDANGFDLCRQIRRRSDVPIVFLTARADELDRVAGLEIGADDYVVKPFSPRELSARVRAILRRARRPADGGETEYAAIEIDRRRQSIRYFGTLLDLTRTEYRLLESLAAHPGWVFSRSRLLELLWDEPGATSDRAVDSHVKSLRSKLRLVRDDLDPIETHRGEGYSLKERP